MSITAKVIAHGRASGAPDLFTLEARYPRLIHAEFMTHRLFSRNASSSRAIPIEKMIQSVIDDPAMPVAWGSNKPGMQAGDDPESLVLCGASLNTTDRYGPYVSPEQAWCYARDRAVEMARNFSEAGYHKQIANRLLEPFGHITVVVTATEWSNFFDLRCHPDADPTMRALAEAMRDAIEMSEPNDWDEYHLPYVVQSDWDWAYDENRVNGSGLFAPLAMISAARCARVSYLTHAGEKPALDKDITLAKRLLESRHLSPFEHQAQADPEDLRRCDHGNFTGWIQHRQVVQ